jgi:beta-glucosidase
MQINARRSSLFSIPVRANLVSHSVVACFLAVFGFVSATSLRAQATPSDEQISQKVEALLSRMTLEEKIGQLTQIAGGLLPGANPEEVVRKGGAGSILWLNDTKRFNEIQHVAVEKSRLHIPVLYGLDVIHGYRTIFPVPLAMAASWDPEVEEKAQTIAAREARAAGIHWTFGPMVDIARDARWGRIVEGAGEDPYLGSAMAAAQVRGFQGPSLGTAPDRVVACAKHFAGYGAAEGGRDYDSVYIPESRMRNVYLPPFQAAVKAGVGTFMSAYMDLNNVPAAGNRWLLRQILRDEWGFQGFVVSDAMAVGNLVIQGFAADPRDAAYRALTAGLDMDMASGTYPKNLPDLVRDGKITMAQIDDAVRPILAVKFKMGLFENPYTDESRVEQVLSNPEHRAYAREAAQRSMVLLRNEGGLLPLSKSLSSIAVIGPLSDSMAATEGSWLVFGHQPAAVTVLEGIRNKLGQSVRIEHANGPDIKRDIPSFFDAFATGPKKPEQTPEQAQAAYDEAVAAARKADVVVMVLGELANMSGEAASRAHLGLPGRQEELLEEVVGLGKPVALVLINGRPLSISWAAEHVPAILEAWEPGSEGGNAVADVLFGDVNPGGKLPATFPRSGAQEPLYYAHNLTHQPAGSQMYQSRYWDGPTEPLYPFGYGLSYTTFEFSNLQTERAEIRVGDRVEISVDVKNTGKVAGDEVVQLYIHQKAGSDSRPVRQLKGFRRIHLAPGEQQAVTLTLGPDELGYWSTNQGKWIQEAADFDLWTGGDSTAELHGTLKVVP